MLNNDEIKNLYVNECQTIKEISEKTGVSQSTIRRRLISLGVAMRPKGNMPGREYHHNPRNKEEVKDIEALTRYFLECRPVNEISALMGVNPKAIKRKIDELGLVRPKSMMSRNQYDDSKDEEIIKLYKEGKSTTEIGKIVKISHRAVLNHLDHCGIERRTLSNSQYAHHNKIKPADFDSYEKMYDLYIVNKLSKREIADLYNSDGGTVDRVLKNLGIPVRGNSEAKIGLMVGEKHPNWKGGRTSLYARLREYFGTNQAKKVLKRDKYTCQMCGSKKGKKHVHHIVHFKTIFEEILNEHQDLDLQRDEEKLYEIMTHDDRFLNLDNLITYCKDCHFKVHGYKKFSNV